MMRDASHGLRKKVGGGPALLRRSAGNRGRPARTGEAPTARRPRGFTLIELMVVIVILGLLAGLVGPRLFGRVGKSKQAAAQAQMELFGVALDNYRLDVGQYPTTEMGLAALQINPGLDGWDGPYLKKEVPTDPWGRPFVYKAPGEHGEYDLISHGADGAPGGEGENADVVSWKVVHKKSDT